MRAIQWNINGSTPVGTSLGNILSADRPRLGTKSAMMDDVFKEYLRSCKRLSLISHCFIIIYILTYILISKKF